MKIALSQSNPTVGAITDNMNDALNIVQKACDGGADLLVFPEMYLSGYPAEDLVLKPAFIDRTTKALETFKTLTHTKDIHILMPLPIKNGDRLYNAAVLIHKGKALLYVHKKHLPNYTVFDEVRVFDEGAPADVIEINGMQCGFMICRDIWHDDVAQALKNKGAEILIAPNASPYEVDKLN
ncbi:MAG: nitrilase-related carbon-nitrogen hydrolase [Verrucomicrobiota bacterium]